jgi:putative transposase
MCQELGVSRSGYYRYRQRAVSKRARENAQLNLLIKEIHLSSHARYGSPRIHAELQMRGIACGKHRVARLMRAEGVRGKASRRKRWNPFPHAEYPVGVDYVKRNFVVSAPNKVWVSDITYIATTEGWVYLLVIVDLFSRKVVGYSLAADMEGGRLIKAFEEAVQLRQPAQGLIFHSDRGMQYVCHRFQACLERYGALSSMSRKGNCFDNAVAESFFHTLKTELIERNGYQTREEARRKIFEYIFIFYNNKRRHSYLNYMTPMEFEQKFGDA